MSKDDLRFAIRSLPFPERVELLEEFWREAETERPGLLDWQKELLDQRLKDAEAHPEDWVSWDDLDARFKNLIEQLAARTPVEGITDADIDREVQAVRNATRPA